MCQDVALQMEDRPSLRQGIVEQFDPVPHGNLAGTTEMVDAADVGGQDLCRLIRR